jgi:hypothetical protein
MTLINPMRTHLVHINIREKSLEKQMIFFGHANGYISLFQGDPLIMMTPILAHQNSIVCLESSRSSMDKSNIFFNNYEILLSSSLDRVIYLWDITINKINQSIELIHLLTIEQEKNLSFQSIKYLSMIDNFLLANYSDQNYLHIWQLLNISIRLNDYDQWGIVEHPTKGKPHHGQIQGNDFLEFSSYSNAVFFKAISATSKLKLFASSDTEGCLKIWDNTNSLLREIYLDKTLGAIEFLPSNGELLIAYQNNIHLILPENYLLNSKNNQFKQQVISEMVAEDNRLEIIQSFYLSYESLPIFDYRIKTHHSKKRLQRFERQLAGKRIFSSEFHCMYIQGRYAVIDSDNSESDHETSPLLETDHLSIVSDDPNWSQLAEDVKDILRMKKSQFRQENKY